MMTPRRDGGEGKPPLNPEMTVAELLTHYPELEERLIESVPRFAKLKNPLLRRTMARMTTLRQAAKVGGITISDLMRVLTDEGDAILSTETSGTSAPDWVDRLPVHATIDARPILDGGEHPIGLLFATLAEAGQGRIVELITPFYPAPLIEKAAEKGLTSHSEEESPGLFRTRFCAMD